MPTPIRRSARLGKLAAKTSQRCENDENEIILLQESSHNEGISQNIKAKEEYRMEPDQPSPTTSRSRRVRGKTVVSSSRRSQSVSISNNEDRRVTRSRSRTPAPAAVDEIIILDDEPYDISKPTSTSSQKQTSLKECWNSRLEHKPIEIDSDLDDELPPLSDPEDRQVVKSEKSDKNCSTSKSSGHGKKKVTSVQNEDCGNRIITRSRSRSVTPAPILTSAKTGINKKENTPRNSYSEAGRRKDSAVKANALILLDFESPEKTERKLSTVNVAGEDSVIVTETLQKKFILNTVDTIAVSTNTQVSSSANVKEPTEKAEIFPMNEDEFANRRITRSRSRSRTPVLNLKLSKNAEVAETSLASKDPHPTPQLFEIVENIEDEERNPGFESDAGNVLDNAMTVMHTTVLDNFNVNEKEIKQEQELIRAASVNANLDIDDTSFMDWEPISMDDNDYDKKLVKGKEDEQKEGKNTDFVKAPKETENSSNEGVSVLIGVNDVESSDVPLCIVEAVSPEIVESASDKREHTLENLAEENSDVTSNKLSVDSFNCDVSPLQSEDDEVFIFSKQDAIGMDEVAHKNKQKPSLEMDVIEEAESPFEEIKQGKTCSVKEAISNGLNEVGRFLPDIVQSNEASLSLENVMESCEKDDVSIATTDHDQSIERVPQPIIIEQLESNREKDISAIEETDLHDNTYSQEEPNEEVITEYFASTTEPEDVEIKNSPTIVKKDNDENVAVVSDEDRVENEILTLNPSQTIEEAVSKPVKKMLMKNNKKEAAKLTVATDGEAQPNGLSSSSTNAELKTALDFPEILFKSLVLKPSILSDRILQSLESLYSFSSHIQSRNDDLPDRFLNSHDETIWAHVFHKNKQLRRDFKLHKELLDECLEDIAGHDEADSDGNSEQDVDNEERHIPEGDEEMEDEYQLDGEDLDDLEREFDNESEEDEHEDSGPEIKKKKFPKSPVDDKFFSLAEMESFVEQTEKEQQDDRVGGLLDMDDSWGGPANYRYEDFFGKLDDVVENSDAKSGAGTHLKKRKHISDDQLSSKTKKRVRFSDECQNELAVAEAESEVPDVDIDEDHDSRNRNPILFGDTDDINEDSKETNLKKNLKKIKETIRKLEEENLQPRSWELSGEVTGAQRDENTLLEEHIEFEYGAKLAPSVTEDFTEKLENLIKQRIKDKVFDDVVRKKKIDEGVQYYRNQAIEDREMMKKSLSEVYEKEYQHATENVVAADNTNEQHAAIEKKMKELFRLIDGLFHYQHTPPEVTPEVKVVSNMAALRVEEVGIMASTDAQLLAPEEIKKKQKGDLKSTEERDSTDKLRARRKKKAKQRAMVLKLGEERALSGQLEAKRKKKKVKEPTDGPTEKLKSSNFFNKLQDTVVKEIQEKTKKKKMKSQKLNSSGSKFKL